MANKIVDIDSKFSVINKTDVQLILQHHLGAKQFSLRSYFLSNLSENAAGFIAEHAILTVNFEVDGFEKLESFFLKLSSPNSNGTYIQEIGAFKKEAQLFNGLIPLLQKCSSKPWSPRCLYTRKDVIVFENLSQKGFRNSQNERKTILDLEHCLQSVKALARFHAASLILEANDTTLQTPNGILAEYGEILRENTYVGEDPHPRKKWLDIGVQTTLALMRLVPELNTSEKLLIIDQKLPEIFYELPVVVKPSSKYRNVVGHGDIWANNMMFRYEHGKPVDCRLVDYQFSRYAAAAWDLMCLLHLATTRDFRKTHAQALIDVYYKTVGEELITQKLDIGSLMPYADFIEASEHFSRPALVEAILFGHTILLPEGLAVQMLESPGGYEEFIMKDREKLLRKAWETDQQFREILTDRLVELFEEYIL